jgi:hypothetical protein
MPITLTHTATRTFTRIDLMKLQIERVLYRCRIDETSTRQILAAIDQKWIAEISLYGMDTTGECHAELYMSIDWARNELHIAAGRNTVGVDDRWRDGIAIEVEKTLALFEDVCAERDLKVIFHTRYRSGVDSIAANEHLGFVAVNPVRWREGKVGSAMSVPELDEFTIGVRLTE